MEGRLIPARAEEKVLTALPLLLQQSHDSAEQSLLLRTLLQVSKSFRRSVQRSGVRCSINVRVSHGTTAGSFAAWLAQHAGVVGEVAAACKHWRMAGAFEPLFIQAVEKHRSQPADAADSTTSATISCRLSTATAPFLLSALRLEDMDFSSILQTIHPVDSLTSLCLIRRQHHFTGSVLASLGALRSLLQLELTDSEHYDEEDDHHDLPLQLYEAVGKMSHLTSLTLKRAHMSQEVLQKLPPSLQALTLHGSSGVESAASLPEQLSLQHLPDLRELSWGWPNNDSAEDAVHLALPQQVTSVVLEGSVHAELPPGVLYVSVADQERCMPVIQQLSAVQGLQHLFMGPEYRCFRQSSLQLRQMQQVASVLGSMQQLTFLHLDCSEWDALHSGWCREVQLGTALHRLHCRALKHLHLECAEFTEADALRLTCLTNLTHLGLPAADVSGPHGAADLVVSALACSMPGLVVLDVSGCGLQSLDLLSVFGRLKRLQQLNLHDNTSMAMTEQDLFRLTVLSELTELSIQKVRNLSYVTVQSFCAAMPHLECSKVRMWSESDSFRAHAYYIP